MGNKLDFEDPIDRSLSMRTILKINFIAEGLIWDLSLFANLGENLYALLPFWKQAL